MKLETKIPKAVCIALGINNTEVVKPYMPIGSTITYYMHISGKLYTKTGRLMRPQQVKRTIVPSDYTFCFKTPSGKKANTVCKAKNIVAECFIPNPHNYKYVHCINGNRAIYELYNLKWVATKNETYSIEERETIRAIRSKNSSGHRKSKNKLNNISNIKAELSSKSYINPKLVSNKNKTPYNGIPKLIMETKEERKKRVAKALAEERKQSMIPIPYWVTKRS